MRKFSCRDEEFDVATGLDKTNSFSIATVGQGTASQPGYAHTIEMLYRDSVALSCVVIEKAMRTLQTRLSAYDRGILS